jgi:predicted amidohydrolase YtcJ
MILEPHHLPGSSVRLSEDPIMSTRILTLLACSGLLLASASLRAADADLILHHGNIITVDGKFSVRQALAIKDGRILRVGTNDEVLQTRGSRTQVIDLAGKTVLPGLIDSHVHPAGAAMTEFDHPIPDMESISDVLAYIRSRAHALAEGEWIEVHQVFITRLREQRYPTRAELDEAAPRHPVLFATGPDASLNTLALKRSGIDRNFKVTDGGPGYVEKDPATGEPTGILRSCTRYAKNQPSGRSPTELDRTERLLELFKDYNSVGLTAIGDRATSATDVERYRKLHAAGRLTVRVAISQHVETIGAIEKIQERIRKVAADPLCKGDAMLRIIGIKTFLDGGMLTGSAYMRQPWGVSRIYSITDPAYRGVLFIPKDRLLPLVQTAAESGLQFTAHSVGDGAVHTLLEVYDELSRTMPLRKIRPCVTHSNFMSRAAIEMGARLGVVFDLQPAWLYLDTRTLVAQFGYERLRYFQPLRSLFEAGVIAGGGSDHMQKIGSLRSVNPYNPFLGMWTTITRRAKWYDGQLHPEEALTREQAIRFYTCNNAYLLFLEDQVGSLEPGKRADFIVVDRDLLTCPVDAIRETQCLRTYLDGKLVYERKP